MELSDLSIMGYLLYSGALSLIGIGLFVIVSRQHVIRILLGLTLLESGVNLMLVAAGFRGDAVAPIITTTTQPGTSMVDPIPQALILTTIVIGVAVLALALAISIQVHRKYGTLNMRKLARILEQEQQPTIPVNAPQQIKNKEIPVDIAEGTST